MLKLIANIGKISATIRKVADTIHIGADAFDVLKKLNSVWNDSEKSNPKDEIIEQEQNEKNN